MIDNILQNILQALVNGVVIGSIFAIGAVALTLVYGILRLVNFAHGELLTIGAFAALVVNVNLGLPLIFGLFAAMAASTAFAVGSEYSLWRPLRRRGLGNTQMMLVSLGLALFARNAIVFIFGPDFHLLAVDRFQTFRIGGINISFLQLVVISVALVVLVAVGFFLRSTTTGKTLRALASNRDLAEASGIDTERMVLVTWIIAGMLAGIAGTLIGILSVVEPNVGFLLLLSLFAAAIVGGLGDAYGTLIGGILLGITQALSTLVINSAYATAVGFVVMIAVLVVRPRGLFNRAVLP